MDVFEGLFDYINIPQNREMLKQILDFPKLIESALSTKLDLNNLKKVNVHSIFWYGMGASALIGEYIKAYIENKLNKTINFTIHRSYFTERSLKSDLIIVYTYSGNTYESLAVLKELIKRGIKEKLIVFSSNGKAESIAQREGITFIKLPKGYVSRSHLPYGVAIASMVLGQILGNKDLYRFDGYKNFFEEIVNRTDLIEELRDFSKAMVGKEPVIIVDSVLYPLGFRFKAQLNENAKHSAIIFEVPEGGHNTIVGLRDIKDKLAIFVVRRSSEDNLIKTYMDTILELLGDVKDIFKFSVNDDAISWKTYLQPTLIVDLLSLFLAEAKGYSAFDIREIEYIKSRLLGA